MYEKPIMEVLIIEAKKVDIITTSTTPGGEGGSINDPWA